MAFKAKIIRTISFLTVKSGVCNLSRYVLASMKPGYIRVVNYHDVPPEEFEEFKRQVDFLIEHFEPATPDDLADIFERKTNTRKPRILFTFDDGFESHGTYVAEHLHSLGIKGWFFVPSAAPDIDEREQDQWAIDHSVLKPGENANLNGRVFAPWSTWKKWSGAHVVASHTHSHLRFSAQVPGNEAKNEVLKSFQLLRENLDITNHVFCWVGGELTSYAKDTALAVREAGTKFAFTTCSAVTTHSTSPLRIERTNLESGFSLDRVNLSTSGLLDIKYFLKRKKLDKIFEHNEHGISSQT